MGKEKARGGKAEGPPPPPEIRTKSASAGIFRCKKTPVPDQQQGENFISCSEFLSDPSAVSLPLSKQADRMLRRQNRRMSGLPLPLDGQKAPEDRAAFITGRASFAPESGRVSDDSELCLSRPPIF